MKMHMKRIVCLLALLLVFAFGWSQTMTIHFKNGNTQKYNMGEIESIEFSQDKNDVIDNVSIVGVWECTYYELDTDYPEMFDESAMQIGDRVCFKSDGTYYTEYKVQNNETGRWSLNGNTLTVAVDASISAFDILQTLFLSWSNLITSLKKCTYFT